MKAIVVPSRFDGHVVNGGEGKMRVRQLIWLEEFQCDAVWCDAVLGTLQEFLYDAKRLVDDELDGPTKRLIDFDNRVSGADLEEEYDKRLVLLAYKEREVLKEVRAKMRAFLKETSNVARVRGIMDGERMPDDEAFIPVKLRSALPALRRREQANAKREEKERREAWLEECEAAGRDPDAPVFVKLVGVNDAAR